MLVDIARVVIAGTHSGVGKTTLTTGLLAALRRRGLRVQAFKAGPDYIDPVCHAWASGRPGRNLDTWLMPPPAVLEVFARSARDADVAVVEGVMGLYDGAAGRGEVGSTALLARQLQAPVVLVADARATARSLAAVALGFRVFDPEVRIAGVIANRVGGEHHAEMLREALAEIGLPLLGAVQRDDAMVMPEAQLGLRLPQAGGAAGDWLTAATAAAERSLDLTALLQVARQAPPLPIPPAACLAPQSAGRFAGLRIGVAQDAAFWFYYADSLDFLTHLGAELVPFSLIDGLDLPPDLDGLYLGGGFPERQAPSLAANAGMRGAVLRVWQDGLPVHAECGGYLYMHQTLIDEAGTPYPMAGCLSGNVRLMPRLQGMGYRLAVAPGAPPPSPDGRADRPAVRGHVFHYSRIEGAAAANAWDLYRANGSFDRCDGRAAPGQVAGYLHLHLPTQPQVAQRFLAACARYRRRKERGQTRRP